MEISNVLVDLGMLPVQDIPQLLKPAWEVLWQLISSSSACKKRWPSVPVRGTMFEMVTTPIALGHLPRRSSAFPSSFFILPLEMAIKYVLVNIYIHIQMLFITLSDGSIGPSPGPANQLSQPSQPHAHPCGMEPAHAHVSRSTPHAQSRSILCTLSRHGPDRANRPRAP
jgi:hypothetical protein